MSNNIIKNILSHFDIPEDDYELHTVAHGLINTSYAVGQKSSGKNKYFLQKIDHIIFTDIAGLMNNIEVVCDHFNGLANPPQHLETLHTKDGSNYYKSAEGEYWRLYDFVGGNTFYRAENDQLASEAGNMFGDFLNALHSIDSSLLKTTIARFHDIDFRYEQFLDSLKIANAERKEKGRKIIELIENNISYVQDVYHEIVNTCPLIATHNDTKLSNLLFDDQQHGICVVDYDTLMPGYLPLDFGDSVRTICSTTIEDDKNIDNTSFDLNIFGKFTTSFIKALANSITDAEIKLLAKSAAYMPFLMGIRMFTDYLNNDTYYSTNYKEHNYDRAANQFTLFMSGMKLYNEMNIIVNNSKDHQPS